MITSTLSQNSSSFAKLQVDQISPTQTDALKNVLAKYDAQNVSEADAKSIVKEVKNLDLPPQTPLTTIFAQEGFDARSIKDQAGTDKAERPEAPPPAPPPRQGKDSKGEINAEALNALNTLLESKADKEVTEDEWTEIYTELESQGIDTTKPFVDLMV